MLYFDNASSTPILSDILIKNYNLSDFYGCTQNYHQKALKNKAIIEKSRITTANNLNVAPRTIFFTPNCTIANNIAINSIPHNSKSIITSYCEHPSVLIPIKKIAQKRKIPVFYVNLNKDSGLDLKSFKKLLKQNQNSFVSLAHLNNLTGRLLPISRVSEICKKNNSLFHSDISQTIAKFKNNLSNLDIDIATASGHKFGALKGAGILYAKSSVKINPLFWGHKNEYSISPGSENILSIKTFAQALNIFDKNRKFYHQKLLKLKKHFYEQLKKNKIDFKSYGFSEIHFSPYFLNLEFPAINDFKSFLIKLDLNNVILSNGTCHFLNINKNIRLSFFVYNSISEIDEFIDILKFILK